VPAAVGVPVKVRVVALKLSQAGSAEPSAGWCRVGQRVAAVDIGEGRGRQRQREGRADGGGLGGRLRR
jgi:hypothetical protein